MVGNIIYGFNFFLLLQAGHEKRSSVTQSLFYLQGYISQNITLPFLLHT